MPGSRVIYKNQMQVSIHNEKSEGKIMEHTKFHDDLFTSNRITIFSIFPNTTLENMSELLVDL